MTESVLTSIATTPSTPIALTNLGLVQQQQPLQQQLFVVLYHDYIIVKYEKYMEFSQMHFIIRFNQTKEVIIKPANNLTNNIVHQLLLKNNESIDMNKNNLLRIYLFLLLLKLLLVKSSAIIV